jgi:hypothetical protein
MQHCEIFDGTESVSDIKYWWTVVSNTSDEADVNSSILADSKAYYCLHTTFRSEQIH